MNDRVKRQEKARGWHRRNAAAAKKIDWNHNLYDEDYWSPLIGQGKESLDDLTVADFNQVAKDMKEYEHDTRIRNQYR